MFCPNCGNNCGDAKFCMRCGNNLSQSMAVRSAGSGISVMPPIGIYKGLWGSLEMTTDSAIILRNGVLYGKTQIAIPYSDIRYVTYMPPKKELSIGFLSIRTCQDCEPLITHHWNAEKDKMSLTFNYVNEDAFPMVFQFLSDCARSNRAYWLIQKRNSLSTDMMKLAESKYELSYYKQYYPDKQKAVSTIQADTGMDNVSAQLVINHVFDVFSNEIFEYYEESFERMRSVRCPHCGSPRIASNSDLRGIHTALRMSSLMSKYYTSREQCICIQCGYVWYQE